MWNKLELLVNDDTVRLCSEFPQHDGALYQLDTLVKLSSSEHVESDPKLYGSVNTSSCILVSDTSVVLLDPSFQNVLLHLYFDTSVDAVCLEGSFLLVGERNGNLHLVYVPQQKIVMTKALQQSPSNGEEVTYKSLILQEDPSSPGMFHLFTVVKDGLLIIHGLDLGKTQTALDSLDIKTLNELQGQIQIEFCSTAEFHELGCTSAIMANLDNRFHLLVGGKGSNSLSQWTREPKQYSLKPSAALDSLLMPGVLKMQVIESLVYVLNEKGMLSVWDSHSFIMLCCWPDLHIQDFLLVSEGDSVSMTSQQGGKMKIITLSAADDKRMRRVMVRSLPAMEVVYSLEVSEVSCLVESGTNMDTIYLLEGIVEDAKGCDDSGLSIVMRRFTEALPENRFNRLLYKHKFEEAEQFAITFGLDVELVYKVKLDAIGGKLACHAYGQQELPGWPDLVEEAKTILAKITDQQYVVQYCLTAFWPTLDAAEEMLTGAANKFPSAELHVALAKLATFSSLHGHDNFRPAQWMEFLNSSDYLGFIYSLLLSGNISGAQHLWLRHEGEFAQQFDTDCLQCLLSSIPLSVPSQELWLWFKAVLVPFIWRRIPHGQKILARWLEQRARDLELTEKSDWPQNGLKLAELGLPSCMSMTLEGGGAEEVKQLQLLVVNLRHLCDLYHKYNCKLTLSEFEMSNTRSMAFLMLDKVLAPELVVSVVENSVQPYAQEHNMDLNTTLLLYIKDLSEACSSQTTSMFAEWEDKAIAILHCMTNPDLVMDAVLDITMKAAVPWSDTVESLVQQHLEKNHPKQELLRESYHCMETKKLLGRYGFRNMSLVTDPMKMVKCILRQNLPTSLEDALCLAKAYQLDPSQVHFSYILQLLDKTQTEEILCEIRRLPLVEARVIIRRLSKWAQILLEEKEHYSEEHKKKKLTVTKVAVEALTYLQSIQKTECTATQMESSHDLQTLLTIASLQDDFEVFLAPDKLTDSKMRCLLEEQVSRAYEKTKRMQRFSSTSGGSIPDQAAKAPYEHSAKARMPEHGLSSHITFSEAGLCRLAHRLCLPEQELLGGVAKRAVEVGNVEKALKLLRELYHQYPNPSTGKVLFWAAQRLCQNLVHDVPMVLPEHFNLPAFIHQLASQASTICCPDLLLDCVELGKNTQRAVDLYCQCQIDDDYGFVAKADGDHGNNLETVFKNFFSEDGIVLDPVLVLPAQYKITNCLMPLYSDSSALPLEPFSLAYCPLSEGHDFLGPLLSPVVSTLQSLQEYSQLELGLGLLLDSYMTILHHVAIADTTHTSQEHKPLDEKWLVSVKKRIAAMSKKTLSMLNVIAMALLQKVLNWKLVDSDLAIGLCGLLPKAEVLDVLWKIITNAWQNYDKILEVAKVGAHICSIYEDQEERGKFLAVITDAKWGSKLGKLGVSMQPVFRQYAEHKIKLIPVLVKNRNITPEVILEYCQSYGLDGEQAIIQLITTLLLEEVEEEGGTVEGEVLIGKAHRGEVGGGDAARGGGDEEEGDAGVGPLERALLVIPQLQSNRNVFISLNAVIPKLSPYNYEKIERILNTLEAANESTPLFPLHQMTGLLQHLKMYRRISPPTEAESTYLFENSFAFTPLANVRLPFHMLLQTNVHFWKIITPELNEETLPTHLLICKLLRVNVDKLYMQVANYVYEKRLKPLMVERARKSQSHTPSEESHAVVSAIFNYTLAIHNLQLATATIHKMAQELTAGTEKTAFLKFCLDLAHKLVNSSELQEEARVHGESFIPRLTEQYQRAAIENVLWSHQLGSPDLLKLTAKPGRLLVALFEHSSIAERMRNPTNTYSYPDIHTIVNTIADITVIDLRKVRNFLLEKWICKMDSSQPQEQSQQDCDTDIHNDPDMMRVVYLLQMYPMEDSTSLLLPILKAQSWPLSSSGLCLTFDHRSRVLYCLSHVADGPTLERLLHVPMSKVKQHIQCYVYLSQLERLNIPYTLELFINSPKEGLIKGLWKNHSHEPKAVRLATELSLEYQMYDPQLWNSILQKLVMFNMMSYLQKVLEAIGDVPALWEVPSLLRTWRSVVLSPFMTASVPLSPDQLASFYKTFLLILKCPFLLSLDLIGVAKRFAQFQMPAYSLGTLLLIPSAHKRALQIQCFLQSCDLLLILDQVKAHMSTGELAGLPSLVRSTVLSSVCENQQYDKLTKSQQHLQDLKQHLLDSRNPSQVKSLVEYLVNHNRTQDALSVAKGYLKSLEHAVGKQVSHSDPIKEYLKRTMEALGDQQDP